MKRILLVAAFSIAPHLYGISSPILDYHKHRQANTAAIARNYHAMDIGFLDPRINWEGRPERRAATEFPLHMYVMGSVWDLLGLEELWGRVLAVVYSAFTAVLLLLFLDRWIPPDSSLLAALIFSLLPVEVYFGRSIQPEAMSLLATIASLYALDRYFDDNGARKLAWWLASVAAAFLAVSQKLPYGYMLGVVGFLALARRGRGAFRDPGALLFIPVVLAGVFAWYKYASSGVFVVPTDKQRYISLLDYGRLPYYIWFQFFSRFPELTVTWPAMPLWIAGVWRSRSLGLPARTLLWGWLACLAAYMTLGGGYLHSHEYTALPSALLNPAFIGLGVLALWNNAGRSTWPARRRALLVALLAAIPAYTAVRIGHWYEVNDRFLIHADKIADELGGTDDLFVCNERASSLMLFYLKRNGWSEQAEEIGGPIAPWVEHRIAMGARFYATRKAGTFSNPDDAISKYFFERYPVAYEDANLIVFEIGRG